MIAIAFASLMHILFCVMLVTWLKLDIQGLGIATNLTYIIYFLCLLLYTHNIPELQEALIWPTREVFQEWGEYIKLSISSTVMLCAEEWSYEILTLMAGMIGVKQQAA